MLLSQCDEHLAAVQGWADQHGLRPALDESLDYLATYASGEGRRFTGDNQTICKLFSDFAPQSFGFAMYAPVLPGDGTTPGRHDDLVHDGKLYRYWFNGGLIYHGPEAPGDGSAPSLSVDLDWCVGGNHAPRWSVHT